VISLVPRPNMLTYVWHMLHRQQAAATEVDTAVVLDIAREGKEAGQLRLTLAPNQRCVFGRQPGGCDVVLEHLSISRQHAHLSMDLNGRCFITDMASGSMCSWCNLCA